MDVVQHYWASATTQSLLLLGAALALAYAAVPILRTLLFDTLAKVPGPWYSPYTESVILKNALSGQRSLWIHSLHAKYGSLIRIGPNEVSCCDPEIVFRVYAQGTPYLKTAFYDQATVFPESPGVFAIRDRELHAKRRRMFSHAFSRSSIMDMKPFVLREIYWMITVFAKKIAAGKDIDLLQTNKLFTSDVITYAGFGLTEDMVRHDKQNTIVETADNMVLAINLAGMFTVPFKIVEFFTRLLLPNNWALSKLFSSVDNFRTFALQAVGDYLKRAENGETDDSRDLLKKLVSAKDEDGNSLPLKTLAGEAGNLLGAGTDTTAVTITYLLWRVWTTPHIKQKVFAELDAAIPDPHNMPDYPDLEKLPWLRACVKETLRVHAAAPASLPRYVPKGGLIINGIFLRPGTVISTQAYTMHRLKDAFGPDADDWRPERWLVEDQSEIKKMDKHMMPFGQGPTICLGIWVAYFEIYLAAAHILRLFDGKVAAGFPADCMDQTDYFLTTPKGHACPMNLTPRVKDLSSFDPDASH